MTSSRRAMRAFGLGLIALAGAFALIAYRHMSLMAAYGEICGAVRHCAACPAAVLAAVIGLSVLAASSRPTLRRAPAGL